MNKEEVRQIKSRIQRLDTLVSQFEQDTTLLHESGVDVSKETEMANRQTELQDEMEQTVSDLLLILDTSGEVTRDSGNISLPSTGRRPVSQGKLPQPTFERPEGRGSPAWSNGSGDSGGN